MLKNFLAAVAFMAAPAWSHVSAPLTILAGSGVPGLADGQGTDAQFDSPTALSLSPSGPVLYVDDAGNTLIRSVSMGMAAQVASLSLDKNALAAAAAPSEIVPFSRDGASDRLAVLCLDGKRILELSGLSGTAHSRVLYSGRALSQLTYMAGQKVFLALSQAGGDLMEAPYSPTRKLRFTYALRGLTFSSMACDGNTLVAFQQGLPLKLYVFAATTITASGLTMTSETDLADPYKGYGPLRVACASFDDGETKTYFWEPGGRGLFRVEGNQLTLLEVPNAEGVNFNNGPNGDGRLQFTRLSGFAVDDVQRAIYLSDAPNNRVLKLKDYDYNLGSFGQGSRGMYNDYAYPIAKPADVRRILFYGTSYSYLSGNVTGKFYNLNKRLEYYLNLKSMSASYPYGFEVLFDGDALVGAGYSGDVFSNSGSKILARKDYHPDFCMVAINPSDLWFCATSYLHRPQNAAGLPEDRFDPEFALESDPAKRYKGLAAELYSEIASHPGTYGPDFTLNAQGNLVYDPENADLYRFYGDNHFTHLLEACTYKLLEAFSAKVQRVTPGAKLFVLLGPQRNFLGYQETVPNMRFHNMAKVPTFNWRAFQALNKDPNVVLINVDDPIRTESVSYFPICLDTDHLDQGTDIAGYLAAEAMWPYLSQNP